MAATRPRHRRHAARPGTGLSVESLETRRVMATVLAVGNDIAYGSQPIVRLVDAASGAVIAQKMVFETDFQGGLRVAMADVDGDKTPEILAASGPGRMGEIRVFKQQSVGGTTVLNELTAYRTIPFGTAYRGGVDVAGGEVDGNGREDIVAAMSTGPGTVKIFLSTNAPDPIANEAYRTIVPFGASFNGGASVAVADIGTFRDGQLLNATIPDNKVEIIVGSGVGMSPSVKAYDISAAPREVYTIRPFSAAVQGGVSVASGRYTADSIDDIIVSAGRGGGSAVQIYNGRVDVPHVRPWPRRQRSRRSPGPMLLSLPPLSTSMATAGSTASLRPRVMLGGPPAWCGCRRQVHGTRHSPRSRGRCVSPLREPSSRPSPRLTASSISTRSWAPEPPPPSATASRSPTRAPSSTTPPAGPTCMTPAAEPSRLART